MKTRTLFTAIVLLGLSTPVFGQGVLYQHLGANNPTDEGFALVTSGAGGAAAAIPDDGNVAAWSTQVGAGGTLWYSQELNPNLTTQNDWELSLSLRVVQSGPSLNNSFVRVPMGLSVFNIWFSAQADGDPIVRVGQFSTGPVYILDEEGAGYHDYLLKYQAGAGLAELWVDGVMRMEDLAPVSQSGTALIWGEGQAGPSQANWSMVSLQVIPEPSTVALLFTGLVLVSITTRTRPVEATAGSHSDL